MSETREYELVYVVSPDVGEEGVEEFHTQVKEIVEGQGGTITNTDTWGRRRLAYEIGKHKEGTYVVLSIEGPGELVGELDRKLKVLDTVLRHLVVRVDEDLRKARHAKERRQSRQQRRRAARGMPPLETPAAPAAAPTEGEASPAPVAAAAAPAAAPAAEPPAPAADEKAEVSE